MKSLGESEKQVKNLTDQNESSKQQVIELEKRLEEEIKMWNLNVIDMTQFQNQCERLYQDKEQAMRNLDLAESVAHHLACENSDHKATVKILRQIR